MYLNFNVETPPSNRGAV